MQVCQPESEGEEERDSPKCHGSLTAAMRLIVSIFPHGAMTEPEPTEIQLTCKCCVFVYPFTWLNSEERKVQCTYEILLRVSRAG